MYHLTGRTILYISVVIQTRGPWVSDAWFCIMNELSFRFTVYQTEVPLMKLQLVVFAIINRDCYFSFMRVTADNPIL